MTDKTRRVTRKIGWVKDDLRSRGCKACGYKDHFAALRHADASPSPMKLAYDDYGWGAIRRAADGSRVLCANCAAIERFELKLARLKG